MAEWGQTFHKATPGIPQPLHRRHKNDNYFFVLKLSFQNSCHGSRPEIFKMLITRYIIYHEESNSHQFSF